jgi:HSP20 family protein
MSSRNPTDWMWAQAVEMLEQAERMHRQFFRLSGSARTQAVWEPPVDMFEDEHEIVIVVALPGVPADRVEATLESGALVVRAESPIPLAGSCGAVRQLEIPYGYFERRITLPKVGLESGATKLANGCLTLRLRKTG